MRVKGFIIKIIFISVLIFIGLTQGAKAHAAPDLWDVLRSQFTIDHEITRPEVQEQINWLIKHPGFVQKACIQAQPYMYHVAMELKKRHMPGELALLPMIESAYDPFSYSRAGAAGLWQLMPKTAKELGIRQDWWFDGRRGITHSTDAALRYLAYLNRFFSGTWIYAIGAYDAGAGTISRAIKANQSARIPDNFWSLPLPAETKAYVPRFFALAEIIANPQKYHVNLPAIPYTPYFEEIDVGSQIDLDQAARLANMTYKEFIKLNPGFNRFATAPYKPFNVLIPIDKVHGFMQGLAYTPADKRVSMMKHQVKPKDTLDSIAARYHSTIELIKQLNQLKTTELTENQTLLIPSSKNIHSIVLSEASPLMPKFRAIPAPMLRRVIHIVQINDTYPRLEKLYGVKSEEIQKWNNLSNQHQLSEGQELIIYKKTQQART